MSKVIPMIEEKIMIQTAQSTWRELIINAIIFREKLVIVLGDQLPFTYHPYYLLTNDYGDSFRVKGFHAENSKMLNFELQDLSLCEASNEEFQPECFPEHALTVDEINNRYVIYANINS